jgi:hypothetical protein
VGDPATCAHAGLYWHPAPANEQGWKCTDCGHQPGEPPGFSPVHDRSHVGVKVECILHLLHESEVIYVSNGDQADSIIAHVVRSCRRRHVFDSVSIARMIVDIEGDARHAKFWREISEGVLAGKDPRPRCACGKLAIVSNGEHRACSHEHMQVAQGRDPKEPW